MIVWGEALQTGKKVSEDVGFKIELYVTAHWETAGLKSGGKQGKHSQGWFTFRMENVMVLL